MSVYHQMGHHSRNLLQEEHLNSFSGAILSPVNESESQIRSQIEEFSNGNFEMIFDPQLYYPNSERGQLPRWSYFPTDVDTADQSSINWWSNINNNLVEVIARIKPQAICSPAVVPRTFPDDYYELNKLIVNDLQEKLVKVNIPILLTLLVRLSDLINVNRSAEIASIISSSNITRIFLVFISDTEPRRELSNPAELIGAMRIIKYFEEAGISVLVGYSSSDIILWKTAGATSCASGKFFNLRRFTPSRWEQLTAGGGQLSYWFEESLMAYIRESDLIRLQRANLISNIANENPYSLHILETIENNPGTAWLGDSWRQYLNWFSNFEQRFINNQISSNEFLRIAETNWRILDERNILLEEIQNDGAWLRQWRRAILEYLS